MFTGCGLPRMGFMSFENEVFKEFNKLNLSFSDEPKKNPLHKICKEELQEMFKDAKERDRFLYGDFTPDDAA